MPKPIEWKSFSAVHLIDRVVRWSNVFSSINFLAGLCSGTQAVQGEGGHRYAVEVVTSAQNGAASNAEVQVIVIGEHASDSVVLNPRHAAALRRGGTLTVELRTLLPLGEVGAVVVHAMAGPSLSAELLRRVLAREDLASLVRDPTTTLDLDHAWGLEEVKVSELDMPRDGRAWRFPMYRWMVGNREGIDWQVGFNEKAYLPQYTPNFLKAARHNDVGRFRRQLPWELPYGGAFPCMSSLPLPLAQAFNDRKQLDFASDASSVAAAETAPPEPFLSFESFNVLYGGREAPWIFQDGQWRRDDVWGAMLLTGPLTGTRYLRQMLTLPPELAHLSDQLLAASDGSPHKYMDGTRLAAELEYGRLFLADFSDLKGMTLSPSDAVRFGNKYVSERAMCVLRARPSSREAPFAMLPICIVLEPDRGADAPIFLPSDSEYEWLNARSHLSCAAAICQELGLHWAYCHAPAEAVCTATYNCLSYAHPLRRLLMPHVQNTAAINATARTVLINAGGIVEQTHALGPHSVNFDEACAKVWSLALGQVVRPDGVSFVGRQWQRWEGFCDLPRTLRRYGLDSPWLEVFPFREDGMVLWRALDKWVRTYVSAYYGSEEDLSEDSELQDFVAELLAALGKAPRAVLADYAQAAHSRNALSDLLTAFIFQVTAMHAATNYPQWEVYGLPAFMSTTMCKPPPNRKGLCTTEREFLDALPTVKTASQWCGVVYTLSDYSDDDFALSENVWVREPALARAQQEYRRALEVLSAEIEGRNAAMTAQGLRHFKYAYLDPKRLPKSVAL